jgi:hypothetical protein
MSGIEIENILDRLEPAEALAALEPVLKKALAHLDEDSRIRFVTAIMQEGNSDKLSSMVNL